MKLDLLQEYDIKFKKFDKKRTPEAQLNDLLNDLKQIGVKIIENSLNVLHFSKATGIAYELYKD